MSVTKKPEPSKPKSDPVESSRGFSMFPPKLIGAIADEVAKTLLKRLPNALPRRPKKSKRQTKKIENPVFLDTSAIIDGRVFDVFGLGLVGGNVVVLESILLELKHIADSQDAVKRERGRSGLDFLDKLKKVKRLKVIMFSRDDEQKFLRKDVREVDEKLIAMTKAYKGRVITCDYNLEKKASIQNVTAINVNALAQSLKVRAVPGEALHVTLVHPGKDPTQGVGYLDDGTMIVVQDGSDQVGKTIDVVVARVIQTAAGRILFAKKI